MRIIDNFELEYSFYDNAIPLDSIGLEELNEIELNLDSMEIDDVGIEDIKDALKATGNAIVSIFKKILKFFGIGLTLIEERDRLLKYHQKVSKSIRNELSSLSNEERDRFKLVVKDKSLTEKVFMKMITFNQMVIPLLQLSEDISRAYANGKLENDDLEHLVKKAKINRKRQSVDNLDWLENTAKRENLIPSESMNYDQASKWLNNIFVSTKRNYQNFQKAPSDLNNAIEVLKKFANQERTRMSTKYIVLAKMLLEELQSVITPTRKYLRYLTITTRMLLSSVKKAIKLAKRSKSSKEPSAESEDTVNKIVESVMEEYGIEGVTSIIRNLSSK